MLSAVEFNWLAIVVAIVVSMLWGFVLYARPIAGAWWMKQIGRDPNNVPKEEAVRAISLAFAMSILLTVGFAIVYGWTGASGIVEGATVGILAGIAFGIPVGVIHPVFEGRPLGVGILYGAQHAVEFLLMGIVFGLLG